MVFESIKFSMKGRGKNSVFPSPELQLKRQDNQIPLEVVPIMDNDDQMESERELRDRELISAKMSKQFRKPNIVCIDLCGLSTEYAISEIHMAIIIHGGSGRNKDSRRANIKIISLILSPNFTTNPLAAAMSEAIVRYLKINHHSYTVPISHGMISVIMHV